MEQAVRIEVLQVLEYVYINLLTSYTDLAKEKQAPELLNSIVCAVSFETAFMILWQAAGFQNARAVLEELRDIIKRRDMERLAEFEKSTFGRTVGGVEVYFRYEVGLTDVKHRFMEYLCQYFGEEEMD